MAHTQPFVTEPQKTVPVIADVDICVLGGSCTGVFAAVRAARLGASVALVEQMNCFGGVATSGMVNIWHSLQDTQYSQQIIGGMTGEVVERLKKRDAVITNEHTVDAFMLNTEELKIELDELVREAKIKAYLHTVFSAPLVEDGRLAAVFVENKSGRGAIRAKAFIDATGDGDLCHRLGLPGYALPIKQPPTTGAKIYGMDYELYGMSRVGDFDLQQALLQHHDEFGIPELWGWSAKIPGVPNVTFQAISRVFYADCADADSLTASEMEGRRQIRAILDIIRKYGPQDYRPVLLGLASYIGIRETRHIHTLHRLTEQDILAGKRFADAIANGTYRVDIHSDDDPGVLFRYLDGREVYHRSGFPSEERRWRPVQAKDPTFYQIPYRSLVPQGHDNLLLCGRSLDADVGAFGAVRVMVNMNQTGEAAGVAAYTAIDTGRSVQTIDTALLRAQLARGGSIML
jgi:hypothetical protein